MREGGYHGGGGREGRGWRDGGVKGGREGDTYLTEVCILYSFTCLLNSSLFPSIPPPFSLSLLLPFFHSSFNPSSLLPLSFNSLPDWFSTPQLIPATFPSIQLFCIPGHSALSKR